MGATVEEIEKVIDRLILRSAFDTVVTEPFSIIAGFAVMQTTKWRERPATFLNGVKRFGLGYSVMACTAVGFVAVDELFVKPRLSTTTEHKPARSG